MGQVSPWLMFWGRCCFTASETWQELIGRCAVRAKGLIHDLRGKPRRTGSDWPPYGTLTPAKHLVVEGMVGALFIVTSDEGADTDIGRRIIN